MTLHESYRTSVLLTLLLSVAAPLHGAVWEECVVRSVTSTTTWQEPLDRAVTLRAGVVPLGQALERVAGAAGVRLSYSSDELPLGRMVCASLKGAVGDVLATLLKDVDVQAVVASADHVVLSPSRARTAASDVLEPVFPLDAVIVTATAETRPPLGAAHAPTRITHGDLALHSSVAGALNTNVPGVWVWQSPIGFTAHYSARGASSFGVSAPKIYIDGIEVANPLLLTQLQPENIERIEVIRGPQGGALYGADATNGVTNIITRHETVDDGAPRVRLRSGLGLSTSRYAAGTGISQDHNLSLRTGPRARSGTLNLALGNVDEYMPGSFSRHASVEGNARLVGGRTMITGTTRYYVQSAGNPASLRTAANQAAPSLDMRQYTFGTRLHFQASKGVTHSVIAGVDGYRLGGVARDSAPNRSVADSVLRAAGDGAVRTTLRMSSGFSIPVSDANAALITLAAEHSYLQQSGDVVTSGAYRTRSSLGLAVQAEAMLFERLSLTSGLRVQRDGVNDLAGMNTLPMLAAAYDVGAGELNVRLRSAYGKAIRWPSLPSPALFYSQGRVPRPALAPEEQSGLEIGVDVMLGETFGVQVTRYDQTASGLLQSVMVTDSVLYAGHYTPRTRAVLQSVGEIANHGWELQGFVQGNALSLSAGLSFTDSRVAKLARGYAGDLRAGDRMLGVPGATASMTASWIANLWSASVFAARAFDWINYDRAALVEQADAPAGSALREYWRRYNGFTHVSASVSRILGDHFELVLRADNLLGEQTGEPDNLTVVPGRTISFGVRAAF